MQMKYTLEYTFVYIYIFQMSTTPIQNFKKNNNKKKYTSSSKHDNIFHTSVPNNGTKIQLFEQT